MLKRLTSFLLCVFLFGVVVMPVNAKKKTAGYFAFTATTANNMLVEPEYIPYKEGQTIK